jgi:hypothetical protein
MLILRFLVVSRDFECFVGVYVFVGVYGSTGLDFHSSFLSSLHLFLPPSPSLSSSLPPSIPSFLTMSKQRLHICVVSTLFDTNSFAYYFQ